MKQEIKEKLKELAKIEITEKDGQIIFIKREKRNGIETKKRRVGNKKERDFKSVSIGNKL